MPPYQRIASLSVLLLALAPNPCTPFVLTPTPPAATATATTIDTRRLSATSIAAPEHHIDPPDQPYLSLSSIAEGFQDAIAKSVTSLFHLDVTAEEFDSSVLAVKGLATPVLVRAPSIGSFSLVRGFTDESLQSFTATVNKVVTDPNNRILTGRAVSILCGLGSEVRVIPGKFDPDKGYSFVEVIDARDRLPSPSTLDEREYLLYIDDHIQDLIPEPCAPTIRQMEKKEPLFRVSVVRLPDDYACIFVGMSHILGDIVTYTALMDQLSSLHDAHKSRPIKWNTPEQATHSISSETSRKETSKLCTDCPSLSVSAKIYGLYLRGNTIICL